MRRALDLGVLGTLMLAGSVEAGRMVGELIFAVYARRL